MPTSTSRPSSRHPATRGLHSTPPYRTAPDPTSAERNRPTSRPVAPAPPFDDELLRAAFRDVHGTRLHGFALLVALGNRHIAADAATEALADGARRAHELRHPERAAAWLRARVFRTLRRRRLRATQRDEAEQRRALAALGAEAPVYDALAQLSTAERAALVVADIERLDAVDIETVLATERRDAQRLVRRARQRYLDAYLAAAEDDAGTPAVDDAASTALMAPLRLVGVLHVPGVEDPAAPPSGELARRVRAVARRALAAGGAPGGPTR